MSGFLPFHADELTAQRQAGGGPAGAAIRERMPEQHRDFFAGLRYLPVGIVATDGWPAATMLTGDPGFIQSPDAATLRIELPPEPGDPTVAAITSGLDIGILGIDFATRRRNRANGRVSARDERALTVAVHQSFGNCPKYIQQRSVVALARPAGETDRLASLDARAQILISQADTFFVASRSRNRLEDNGGADISHRGGRPGFVRIAGDVLTIPDFRGNRYFNTLGNLLGEPRTALLFLDFEQGDLLHLQGEAEIDWSAAAGGEFPGAERLWRFHVARGWRRPAAVPLCWSFIEQAPSTARTGLWRPQKATA
ncbi:pyridoxamine 5'-phosphate oxidase family protein [Telmatospirillum siberiense]|uniref:Pyridoxamine 5'-phosphate oxidase n=1 Tax=Telmatospirillum siberiense TaxID=382514 RepID=A0A2N3PN38_9PROT|nr:pyridoxamine 5'-phosphate oxidase family protein [Telmatospirillum siberiense]PKU21813.1 pyridoxamine 5'-phosphate oxidase [Telmatospirillum siberiense]